MLAIGIDPGTAICGYGVVESRGSTLRALDYGAIMTQPTLTAAERLQIIHNGLDNLLKSFKPDIAGVEQLFFNKNVRTAMAVGQARGVILLAIANNGVRLAEFTPLQVKQSVVGYGKATKDQIIFMVQRLLGLTVKPHPDDVADALAMAICSLHSAGTESIWSCKR